MALAAPLAQSGIFPAIDSSTWTPEASFKTTCDTDAQQMISLDLEPQLETVLNNACAELMPPCAYQERLPKDTMCIKSVVWPLEKAAESLQTVTVQTLEGEKNTEGKVKCESHHPSLKFLYANEHGSLR